MHLENANLPQLVRHIDAMVTNLSGLDRKRIIAIAIGRAFGVACELHRDWRNDIEGLATLFSNHIPDYRNLMTSYDTLTKQK